MWRKQGTSRATSPWELGDISSDVIIERVVGILARAADHNPPVDHGLRCHSFTRISTQ